MNKVTVNEAKQVYIIPLNDEQIDILETVLQTPKSPETKDTILREFDIDVKSIIAYGDTDDVSKGLLSNIIPTDDNPMHAKTTNGHYKCYVSDSPSIPVHEDVMSAWKCLMIKLAKPKNVLIFKGKSS
jgi:hypothetical protein